MKKLIAEIPDELHKDLKYTAIELGTTLKVVVISILGITEYRESDPL